MGFIYVITNKINKKQYVGQTCQSIHRRWQMHQHDARYKQNQTRPICRALNKYGVDNFIINKLEECDEKDLNEREQYWIQKLDTYNNGYNATLGGDSRRYYDYEAIANKMKELKSSKKVQNYFNCSKNTVRTACKELNVLIPSVQEQQQKAVAMIDIKTNEIIKTFKSTREAARFINKPDSSSNISGVCRGKRKTAYGYKWQYI